MIDRYYLFCKLMTLVDDDFTVTDADMDNYLHEMTVTGVDGDTTITITATIKKEAQKDA